MVDGMYEHKIAIRNVISNKKNTMFSVIAVALAIGIIIIFMGLISGFAAELTDSITDNSPHIRVSPSENNDFIHLYQHHLDTINGIDGVSSTSLILREAATLEKRNKGVSTTITGIVPEQEIRTMGIDDDLIAGDFYTLDHRRNSIVISTGLANELNVEMGDRITMAIGEDRSIDLEVVGLVLSGSNLAYVHLDFIQDYFGHKGKVSTISVVLDDIYAADEIAAEIERETELEATSWIEDHSDLFDLLAIQNTVAWIFYILIYVVAGFGIANVLLTMVMEKKKEIGMLMAMGATRKSIVKIFFIEATFLGIVGLILGCIIALVGIHLLGLIEIEIPIDEVYADVATVPLDPQLIHFLYAGGFAMVVNVIASIVPARQASKLDPVEAIEDDT